MGILGDIFGKRIFRCLDKKCHFWSLKNLRLWVIYIYSRSFVIASTLSLSSAALAMSTMSTARALHNNQAVRSSPYLPAFARNYLAISQGLNSYICTYCFTSSAWLGCSLVGCQASASRAYRMPISQPLSESTRHHSSSHRSFCHSLYFACRYTCPPWLVHLNLNLSSCWAWGKLPFCMLAILVVCLKPSKPMI